MKGIDALTREQLVQIMAYLGIGNAIPVFSMVPAAFVPIRPAALVPYVTEEDKIILNNVQQIIQFLTAGTASNQVSQVYITSSLSPEENYVLHFAHNKRKRGCSSVSSAGR